MKRPLTPFTEALSFWVAQGCCNQQAQLQAHAQLHEASLGADLRCHACMIGVSPTASGCYSGGLST